jgi:GNAT superfamily N-acetyltransferase
MMRIATRDEIAMMLDWAAEEGWNPGLADAEAFRAADPAGFFVAERDGAPVAAISVVNHDDGNAFLGLYLCRPDWRGRGIGLALWQHALRHAGGRSVGLDGVAAQEAAYARSGFVRTGATRRWQGRLAAATGDGIRPAGPADAARLAALDRAATGYDRAAFRTAWFADGPTRRTLIDAGGEGLVTVRLCREGCKIGPLVAPDAPAALRLVRAALAEIGETAVAIDLPEASRALAGLIQDAGFANPFTTARMVRGTPPAPGPWAQAIATMELG